mmetsp:Transcript_59739/g.64467  ORF Transcript_59739/g.64467 Transcript_59739/m.64467 type:complete len:205 (-) Transcript_59739:85-699(-)
MVISVVVAVVFVIRAHSEGLLSRYVFDGDSLYGNDYDEIWNINEGFKLHYQRYMQEQQQHVLQIEQLQKQDRKQEPKFQQYVQLQKEMIQKREEIQEEMFQNFKVCTSDYKESNKRQQQEKDLQFQKQEQQEKDALQQETEEELQLEKIRFQKAVDKESVVGGSGAAVGASYLNKGKQQQEIELQLRLEEQQKDEELQQYKVEL